MSSFTYQRGCGHCKWKDNVRPLSSEGLDQQNKLLYECPECGYESIFYMLYANKETYGYMDSSGQIFICKHLAYSAKKGAK
jgi:hypothetical protein